MKSAFDAFMDIHHAGLVPDIVTYNTLISGYFEAFDMVKVNQFMNSMYASGWEPDITTYNIQIHGFCSSRKMNKAVMILDELLSAGVAPNTVTYNTMMNGVCKDMMDRAMIITAKLLKMAFIPNVITTNVLLSHFCKQGMPKRALMWCQKLSEISFEFDESHDYRNLAEPFAALGTKCVELKASGERRHKEQRIMNLLGTRETAFAFSRFAFRDDSEEAVRFSCTVAHILATQNLRYLAQDVVSCVIRRIGETRSEDLVQPAILFSMNSFVSYMVI
ncbi:hypothetical protein V6N13_086457 [Hibiscus sabdariffa]